MSDRVQNLPICWNLSYFTFYVRLVRFVTMILYIWMFWHSPSGAISLSKLGYYFICRVVFVYVQQKEVRILSYFSSVQCIMHLQDHVLLDFYKKCHIPNL